MRDLFPIKYAANKLYSYSIKGHGRFTVHDVPVGEVQEGEASWYGPGFHGKKAADGSIYSQNAMTIAHRSLPLGTRVAISRVSRNNGDVLAGPVSCTVTDRGPFAKIELRICDCSKQAARALGYLDDGHAWVRLEVTGFAPLSRRTVRKKRRRR